ncbi:MAG: YidC/Oxa1 family membrane protein insertase [Dehalococcoidia bacterium]|nr:MAG: YidC/Oxa1 family membrane protein insertase [Dehalococcoidia bacterium]
MDFIGTLFHVGLVVPMTNVLIALARIFGGNYGVAIIIFTLLMRFITWPLTASQYRASRAMQTIQPQLQELQKKYKGKDPKKLQAETMALYREAGVNPLGCILPMIVQMPIWIALYQVIRLSLGDAPESLVTLSQNLYPIPFVHTAVPLNNHMLIWNLGQPDATYILPFLVAATMYIQQKLITPTPAAGTLTPQQQQQQQTTQMMTWMMPLMFGFWSLSVPAGLALYWFISNLSGIVLQYFYMGRKVDWRSLLTISPTSAAKPAGKDRAQPREKSPAAADVAATEADISEPAAAQPARQDVVRRKRHGRRRGKR